MKKIVSILILQIFGLVICRAQSPIVKGNVDISVSQGIIKCDFSVTNVPNLKDYFIFLNTGLNVRYFRNIEDTYTYYTEWDHDDTASGESWGYYFPDTSGKAKFMPHKGFRVSYVGAFPVLADTLKPAGTDWKGNVADNGKTIRATEQSAWYPVIYNKKEDKLYQKVAYDINVTCKDCQSIYLNGSAPVQGTSAHFKSDSAYELLLFAGNYKIDSSNHTYFLNSRMTTEQMKEFGEMTDNYKRFYEKHLAIPYLNKITYIETTPTSKYNGFLFVTYPTITSVGWDQGFAESFSSRGNRFRPFIAHELAHYYFGTYLKCNSELGDAISEGFAEFLSLKVSQSLLADTVYPAKIKDDIKNLKNFAPVSLGNVKSSTDIKDRETYVYTYFPIILTAIEKEIGKEKMWKWMQLLLTTKTEFTNYEFLKSTLSKAISDESKLDEIEKKYFKSDTSVQNAIATIERK